MRPILELNPLSPFIEATRAALLEARAPSWTDLALIAFWVLATSVLGLWMFNRFAPRFAEEG
jgi:ABC-type polysaccharide/polyol phosphate export permease